MPSLLLSVVPHQGLLYQEDFRRGSGGSEEIVWFAQLPDNSSLFAAIKRQKRVQEASSSSATKPHRNPSRAFNPCSHSAGADARRGQAFYSRSNNLPMVELGVTPHTVYPWSAHSQHHTIPDMCRTRPGNAARVHTGGLPVGRLPLTLGGRGVEVNPKKATPAMVRRPSCLRPDPPSSLFSDSGICFLLCIATPTLPCPKSFPRVCLSLSVSHCLAGSRI